MSINNEDSLFSNKLCIVAPGGTSVIGNIAKIYGNILEEHEFECIYIDSKPYYKMKMLIDLIKNEKKYTCIHVHSSGYLGDIPLIWTYIISKMYHKKVIITWHCGSPYNILEKTHNILNILFKAANLVTVPSNYSKKSILDFNINIGDKLVVFPNLINHSKYSCNNLEKNNKKVVTISSINKWYIYRKGLVEFVQSACYLPDFDFYLIGKYDDSINDLKKIAPNNVHFTGFLPDEELIKHLCTSSVYCQLSIFESFGYALAEAMLCGCVPVVTQNASLPEVVGDAGYYVNSMDPSEIANKIKDASISGKFRKSRSQIVNNFAVKTKKIDFVELVSSITQE
ncbi:glycosyltransferase family 4 protein [uncultured Methanolobus sp.]|uniref:glycosyltransferase family 4 protein n=1 Tax=uncultured Methanolobus sp. TaxID=218300 RepID=UPI002AAA929F|nr:glycosyltransferase family 4 protein [uncultured Methanolobus sp.]